MNSRRRLADKPSSDFVRIQIPPSTVIASLLNASVRIPRMPLSLLLLQSRVERAAPHSRGSAHVSAGKLSGGKTAGLHSLRRKVRPRDNSVIAKTSAPPQPQMKPAPCHFENILKIYRNSHNVPHGTFLHWQRTQKYSRSWALSDSVEKPSRIFGSVIELVRVDLSRWIRTLPSDGATDRFIERHRLMISELITYSLRARNPMLRRIPGRNEVFGSAIGRKHNEVSMPIHLGYDLLCPLQLGES